MDKDRIKGKANEVAGRTKRQAGEWTGNTRTQAQGGAQEVKGRLQNAWGKVKDATRESNQTRRAPHPEHSHSGRH
jgi:uncharacterized protein YjbJ (UPF0337 family)